MEFKVVTTKARLKCYNSINRIRLEFKGRMYTNPLRTLKVLIESDWNLKFYQANLGPQQTGVLIESDWNLKTNNMFVLSTNEMVLIESDWNLKLRKHLIYSCVPPY